MLAINWHNQFWATGENKRKAKALAKWLLLLLAFPTVKFVQEECRCVRLIDRWSIFQIHSKYKYCISVESQHTYFAI